MSELHPIRRIVTGHNDQGLGCITSNEAVASEILLGGLSTKGRIWTTFDGLPTKDNNNPSADGFKKDIDEANFGLVPNLGMNVQYTELEPSFITPMVCNSCFVPL
ncbi:hypothetical protein D9758_000317 [Tetrapyrgos nigripes]|uniref:Uncharacterized protein n=1 Tax=Tetrapyrgos nigripes TaxID=182062 RepID=A0A8H5H1G6_9AGAR|nr:hypothetical protein D9758_000317 [Tetrapyrgos nigripes]